MKRVSKTLLRILLVIILLISIAGLAIVLPIRPEKGDDIKLGTTFSVKAAETLGLDWREVYQAMLTDLHPDLVRLPVYWDRVEASKGVYDFSEIDEQLDALEGTQTKAILVVGHKVPRWPECHLPEWAKSLSKEEAHQAVEGIVRETVNRYKNRMVLDSWQVENERLFHYGECPSWSADRGELKSLILSVKDLDPTHPVTTSDSGELSFWLRTSTLPIDALNISLYRSVYADWHGYFFWPVNPYFYKWHAALVKPFVKQLQISELQMEPWGPKPVHEMTTAEMYKSFHPYEFNDRIDFAERTGAQVILTWGVEWWYYMKVNRLEPLYWQQAMDTYDR